MSNSLYIFHKHNSKYSDINVLYNKISIDIRNARNFIAEHDNIIVVRTDKGNNSILMFKTEYKNKMNTGLEDPNTYVRININHTSTLQRNTNK